MAYISVDEIAYRTFGNFFYKNRESFRELKAKMRYSHIPLSVDQYLASALIYSIFAGIIGGFFRVLARAENLRRPCFSTKPFC